MRCYDAGEEARLVADACSRAPKTVSGCAIMRS